MLIRTHHVKETMILWMCVRSDIRCVCLSVSGVYSMCVLSCVCARVDSFLTITPQVAKGGEIKKVKVLSCLAMIDEGTYNIIIGMVTMVTYRRNW